MDALTVEFDYDSLGDKADIVRGLAKRIHARVKRAVEDVIEIGTCLAETKRFLGRGRWGEWLKAEFRWSSDTATNFMNLAARHSQIPNYSEFAPTVLYELCRPGTPVAAIEQASEMVSSGVPITVAAVKEIIEQHRDEDEGEQEYDDETELTTEPIDCFPVVRPEAANIREPEEVRSHGIVTSLSELVDRGAKFSAVYADPPWAYSNKATRAAVDGVYKSTMTVDEICAEPVAKLCEERCHLHLWTTNAFLFEARRVLEAWGFEYKSCFVWVKTQMGIGNYWRVSHEFMLLGVKGGMTFRDRGQMSWLEAPRTSHSRKPEQVRQIIEKVSPGPYLEMYGRQPPVGDWTVYGNEVSKGLFDECIRGSERG